MAVMASFLSALFINSRSESPCQLTCLQCVGLGKVLCQPRPVMWVNTWLQFTRALTATRVRGDVQPEGAGVGDCQQVTPVNSTLLHFIRPAQT